MAYDAANQLALNASAITNPQPGDYWHEMYCPYFLVVRVQGEQYTVLSCLGGPNSHNRKHEVNARIDLEDGWTWDLTKSMVVDREWITKAVKYSTIDGFVADVVRSSRSARMAEAWRISEVNRLRAEWESLSGWSALIEEPNSPTS